MKIQEDTPDRRAMNKALRLLSFRDHSCKEMRAKLSERGYAGDVLDRTITRLIELKYLDDDSFALRCARHLALDKLYGDRRIEAGLQEKGIPRELIPGAISNARLEMNERKALALLIEKKVKGRQLKDLGPADQRRIAQFLMRKGFSPSLIHEFLGEGQIY